MAARRSRPREAMALRCSVSPAPSQDSTISLPTSPELCPLSVHTCQVVACSDVSKEETGADPMGNSALGILVRGEEVSTPGVHVKALHGACSGVLYASLKRAG